MKQVAKICFNKMSKCSDRLILCLYHQHHLPLVLKEYNMTEYGQIGLKPIDIGSFISYPKERILPRTIQFDKINEGN